MDSAGDITILLQRASEGDGSAASRLVPLVYDELRRIAGADMHRQDAGHTLQATALVNEAYLKLVGSGQDYADRVHFVAVASLAMRQILTDYARRKKALRRGGDRERDAAPVDAVAVGGESSAIDPVELSEALEKLGASSERRRRIVELRFFGGLTMEQTARALGVSLSTAEADWRAARAWLTVELAGPGSDA